MDVPEASINARPGPDEDTGLGPEAVADTRPGPEAVAVADARPGPDAMAVVDARPEAVADTRPWPEGPEGPEAAVVRPRMLRVRITVRDTGIGLSADQQAKLFIPFSQATSLTHSTYGGSGMGLFIVKELVSLMGGRIDVVSAPGHGASFTVELPLERDVIPTDAVAEPTPPSLPPPSSAEAQGRPARILVVDDNEINRKVVSRQLATAGMDVVTASDGAEAVRIATAPVAAVDLIVLDIEMPIMNGLEAATRIREHEREHATGHVPIIGLSGNAREEHRNQAIAAGMDDYVVKPYDRATFVDLLKRYL